MRIRLFRLGGFGQRSANPFYLVGGISLANCIAAYQPKGAASLAASYINLANPGTYDLADDTHPPDWDAVNGWKGGAGKYLISTITPAGNQTWSIFVRYAGLTSSGRLVGVQYTVPSNGFFYVLPVTTGNTTWGSGTKTLLVNQGAVLSGVIGLAGKNGYYNGAAKGTMSAGTSANPHPLLFCGCDIDGVPTGVAANILAVAIYNIALTDPQAVAVTDAMNTL